MATLHNLDTGAQVAGRVRLCRTAAQRLRGLLGVRSLAPDQAVWIEPCDSIHTFFMQMSIDVAFLDRDCRVVRLIPAMSPWRICLPVRRAVGVIEGPVGMIARGGMHRGTRLEIRGADS